MQNGRRKRILLVEDHADSLVMTARILRHHGYDVHTASTKAKAVEFLEQEPFDLLIGDLELPDGDGLDLMREVAKNCMTKGIACTGYGDESDIEKSRAAGYSAHLTKPIDLSVLFDTIDRLLSDAWG